MQTIIGAGGTIGKELAKTLPNYTDSIRLVSRNPEKVNETDILLSADITDKKNVDKAVRGSSIVYVTVGFPYSYKVWEEHWPPFIRNVIDACKRHDSKLVFFDNVYMYDKNHMDNMTEETPVNPPSKKGKIRAQLAEMILNAVDSGKIKALIARSADFYGPAIQNNSFLTESVFKPLSQGKKANWIGNDDCKHSFTYTPDAGKATAMLGNTDDAYGEVWHLPTASDPLTGKEIIHTIADKFNTEPKYRCANKFLLRLFGIFSSILRETVEMTYQYDRDYIFKSDKFENYFDFTPTSYKEGINIIIEQDY